MHKGLWTFLLLALVAAILAPPAGALTTFPDGEEYRASVTDRSAAWNQQDGDRELEPVGPNVELQLGDEQRNVFSIDAVSFGSFEEGTPVGTHQIFADADGPAYTHSQLVGLLYDVEVIGFGDKDGDGDFTDDSPPDADEPNDIYFGPAGRYTDGLTAANADGYDNDDDGTVDEADETTQGTWTDAVPSRNTGLTASTAAGYGGLLVVYDDDALGAQFVGDGNAAAGDGDGDGGADANDGRADWRQPGDSSGTSPHPGAAAMAVPGVLTNADYFPTISDVPGSNTTVADSGTATPWLVAVLAPLSPVPGSPAFPPGYDGLGESGDIPNATTILENDFNFNSGGGGFTMANVIGGAGASQFGHDVFGPGWDIRLDFEVGVPTQGGLPDITGDSWTLRSDDPAQWTQPGVIPEPATMFLLGIGLVGLVGLRGRKRS